MSYFTYQVKCEKCSNVYDVAFGIVGMTVIAQPPEKCPNCNSDKIKNLSMFPRTKGEEVI